MEYGLIGANVTFSYSKYIHSLLGNNSYELNSLTNEDLISLLKKKDFLGLNITIPYKETVIPYLDKLSNEAKKIGAVNTIINKNGLLIGYNTDALAFEFLLKNNNINVRNKKIIVLGTGGTSKTVKYVLLKNNAGEIYFVSRNKKKDSITYQEVKKHFDVDIIINTTPYGMYPNLKETTLINISDFPYLQACIDVIYNPYKTQLLIEAKNKNIKIVSGLEMLVYQACFASELFFNKKYSINYIRSIYRQSLLNFINIVLIGMPASGKSTLGKQLSKKLNRPFYDVDKEIENKTNMKIKDYFSQFGEESFRKIETEVILELSKKQGAIISLGGGSLIKKENRYNIEKNSIMIFLNRDISFIKNNKKARLTRPLLKDEKDIDLIYSKRIDTYLSVSDIKISTNGTILHTLNKILEALL